MALSSTSQQDINYIASVLTQVELKADIYDLPPIYQHPYRVMAQSVLKAVEHRNSPEGG